jgi:antibiotic biosynthesis monooxygenase (ABM) superfamily enzyme
MKGEDQMPKPKIWKRVLVTWLFAYPLINVLFLIIGPYVHNLHFWIRSLIMSAFLAPALGLGLPAVQKKLYSWLIK